MELIIDLIFDNMFIVIIIFGIISSFWNKKNPDVDETTKHPSQPPLTPVETEKERQAQHRKKMTGQPLRELMEQMERQISAALDEPEETVVTEASETAKQEQLRLELERQKQLQQSTRPERKQYQRENLKQNVPTNSPIYANDLTKQKSLSFNKETITQGIIYSEILSKPRSLNPYQRGVKK